MAKKAHIETIEDITENCNKECILKAMAIRSWDDRTLEQIRCIGFYKKECEKNESKRYTWTDITRKWNEDYGERFSEVYNKNKEHLRAKAIYNIIMGREPLENGLG